jgi:hypothetical protein
MAAARRGGTPPPLGRALTVGGHPILESSDTPRQSPDTPRQSSDLALITRGGGVEGVRRGRLRSAWPVGAGWLS